MAEAKGSETGEGAIPQLVVWEAYHEVEPHRRSRDDLSTLEALRLFNEVRCFGRVALQLVGRPLRRSDLTLLVEHGNRLGLSMRVSPGPDVLRAELAGELRDAGLAWVVLDADARAAALQEEIRLARTYALGVQVQMRASAEVVLQLETIGRALQDAGAHVWTLSFGVEGSWPRGAELDAALRAIVAAARGLTMHVEVAGAPQLRRVLAEDGAAIHVGVAPREGYELLYIAGDGVVQPSAELELALGNARQDDVMDTFRDAPALCALRTPAQLRGKCRVCEFAAKCGGSRARAQHATGDWLGPDPACAYRPAAYAGDGEQPQGA